MVFVQVPICFAVTSAITAKEVKQKLMGHKGNLTSHYTSEKMKSLAEAVEHVETDINF